MPRRLSSIVAVVALGVTGCTGSGEPAPDVQAVLQMRLVRPEEVPIAIRASDSDGRTWARHYEENFPAKVARECGVERFDVESGSDFFQAVHVPIRAADEALFECIASKANGYLRLSIIDPESR